MKLRTSHMMWAVGLGIALLTALACEAEAGPSVEFAFTPSEGQTAEFAAEALLGFVSAKGADPLAIENGGRVSVGDDKVVEVFLSPYPPEWNTDLHLFLLSKDDFEPVENVEVDLDYDMVFMNHGIDALSGKKIDDGHYLLPLSFVMYGDWSVDVRMDFAGEAQTDLQFIVKFKP